MPPEIQGGYNGHGADIDDERLQGTGKTDDDHSNDVFAIDKGIRPEERDVANCIEARENRGYSNRRGE